MGGFLDREVDPEVAGFVTEDVSVVIRWEEGPKILRRLLERVRCDHRAGEWNGTFRGEWNGEGTDGTVAGAESAIGPVDYVSG